MQESKTKTNAWIKEVKIATAIKGRGRKNGMMDAMTKINSSSAKIFPNKRMDRDTTREK